MAGPTKTFKYNFDVNKSGNTFTVAGAPIGGMYNVYDDQSNSGIDSNAQLGDVANDQFRSTPSTYSNPLVSTYIGKTSNGFVAKRATYYLYTDSFYSVGATAK